MVEGIKLLQALQLFKLAMLAPSQNKKQIYRTLNLWKLRKVSETRWTTFPVIYLVKFLAFSVHSYLLQHHNLDQVLSYLQYVQHCQTEINYLKHTHLFNSAKHSQAHSHSHSRGNVVHSLQLLFHYWDISKICFSAKQLCTVSIPNFKITPKERTSQFHNSE
jgi:hypothetical protein